MKYFFLFFFLILFNFSNAQYGNNRIQLGGQVTLTPYLQVSGYGYHGEYEYTFGNRYSASIGYGQATGKDESNFRSRGNSNGVPFDYSFSIAAREGINYLDISIFSRLFRKSQRNHFKVGSGLTFQSIWVEYLDNVDVVGGVIQELELNKQTINIGMANLSVQNNFYLTPEIFLNTKLLIKVPLDSSKDSSFQRSVQYTSTTGVGGGRSSSGADLNVTATFILGLGYKF